MPTFADGPGAARPGPPVIKIHRTFISIPIGPTTSATKGAVICQDGVCAFVSAVGVAVDGLQICTSFILSPNITSIVTIPSEIDVHLK